MMVQLDLLLDAVENAALGSHHSTDDDLEEVIINLDDLLDSVEELLPVARTVTELGVGGRSHLTIAKATELQRRRIAREAAREASNIDPNEVALDTSSLEQTQAQAQHAPATTGDAEQTGNPEEGNA